MYFFSCPIRLTLKLQVGNWKCETHTHTQGLWLQQDGNTHTQQLHVGSKAAHASKKKVN